MLVPRLLPPGLARTHYAPRMPLLRRHHDLIHTADAPTTFMGLAIGTRMTIVKLPSGELLLHSPIPISDVLRPEIDALGPVAHVVAPNVFHHLHVAPWLATYTNAKLHAAAGLVDKRRDLRIDRVLSSEPDPAWGGAFSLWPVEGCLLGETVFHHAESRTLISSDLLEYFTHCDHAPTRLYLKASGIWQKPGWARFLRPLYRDKAKARASIEKILALDFDRVILAHGDVIETGAKDAVRSTFHFLGVH